MAIGKAEIGGGIASGVADAIRLFGPGMIDRRQAEQQLQQQAAEREQAMTAYQAIQQAMVGDSPDLATIKDNANVLLSSSNPAYQKWGLQAYEFIQEYNKPRPEWPTGTRTEYNYRDISPQSYQPKSGFGTYQRGISSAQQSPMYSAPFLSPRVPEQSSGLSKVALGAPNGIASGFRPRPAPGPSPIVPNKPFVTSTEVETPLSLSQMSDAQMRSISGDDIREFSRLKEAQQRQVNAAAQQEQNDRRFENENRTLALREQELQLRLDKLRQQASSPDEVNLIDYYRANKSQLESNNPDEWRPAMISFIDEFYRAYKRKPTVVELQKLIPSMNETEPQNQRLLMSLLRPLAAGTMSNIGIIHQGNPDSLAHYGTSFVNELMRNVNQDSAPSAPAVGNLGQGGGVQQQAQLTPEQLLVVDEMVAAYSEAELSGMMQRASAANDTSSAALFNAALQKKRQAGVR